ERFKAVIAALAKRPMPILFIDEIHSTVGAGATTGGTMDLATLIKPILTTGQLRVVGSTTHDEFKHIEKDRALARRLQKIAVDEPSIPETVRILQGLRSRYEAHHRVRFTDEALEAAARLAARHLRDYKLPDSAIDVLDESGARMRLSRGSIATLAPDTPPDEITLEHIESVIARMARIPAKQASSSDKDRLKGLEESLGRVVFGQEEAVRTVARAIKRSRAGLGQPDRPAGCFLFTGPTGVGKTELAKQLAVHLGNEFLRYDMSEYMEKHAVARLIGAPPGYVGFEQGGLLVDGIRQHPYAVLLLDEIEKAHPDIFNILLQVMDHATLTDNNGRKADFRQVVLIMTSNAGSRELSAASIGFWESGESARAVETRLKASHQRSKQAIDKVFSPEFRNRLDAIVSFDPLAPAVMETIVEKFILQLEAQLAERRVAITLQPEAREWLARKGYDPVFGARPLARVIQTEVRDPLTDEILFGRLEQGGTVTIGITEGKLTFDFADRSH
nr:AAA family ATPase [Acidobacteriota bacterium]